MSASRFLPRRSLVWLACAICCASFFWLGHNALFWGKSTRTGWGYYGLLTEGFLSGKLSLSVEPDAGLKALKDPYDPAANLPYRLDDVSYYRGKYYLYFGPAPALVVMLPVRLLTGYLIPDSMVAALFASAALAALTLLLVEVRDRHFPDLSDAYLALCLLFLAHAGWLQVTMERPAVWEMAILSEVAMLAWALYFLWRTYGAERKGGWAAVLGLAGVLALASRPTSLVPVAVLLGGLAWEKEGWLASREGRRATVVAALIVVAGGLGLLAYNQARFGSALEFGQHYQLWGGLDERQVEHFSPRYWLYNLRTYLVSLPHTLAYFPFFVPTLPVPAPHGHLGGDAVTGIVVAVPVLLAAIVSMAALLRGSLRARGEPLARLTAVAGIAGLGSAALLVSFAGATSRYVTEGAEFWLVPAGVGLFLLGQEGFAGCRRLAIAAGTWGIVYSWLTVFSIFGMARWSAPGSYRFLSHWCDYPSLWYAQREGISYGPATCRVRVDPGVFGASVLASNGVGRLRNLFVVRSVDPGHVRFEFYVSNEADARLVLSSEPVAIASGSLEVWFEAPWLYPPEGHPYWERMSAKDADSLQHAYSVAVGGAGVKLYSNEGARTSLTTSFSRERGPSSPGAWLESVRQ